MRVVIAGAAGFLGSHLVEKFLENHYEVVGLDNFITGNRENLEEIKNPGFSFIEHDVTKPINIEGRVDGILHFASPASPIDFTRLPLEILDVNSQGTRHCLDFAREKNARFFMASTSEVYGDPIVHPQNESYYGNVNPTGIRSVYDESKRFAEALIYAYHRKYNTDVRVVRIFNTYGPRMRPKDGRVIPTFIQQALTNQPISIFGEGKQTRSFCYVSDLVEGIFRLYQSDYTQPMNIGNPDEYSMLELVKEIEEILGKSLEVHLNPLPADDPRKRKPDISLARSILKWEPRVPLSEGLKKTIEWFVKKLNI